MQNSKSLINLDKKEVAEAITDYEFTCHTIVAFEYTIKRYFNGTCRQGPKLKTSENNEIQANTEVTPDIVIEIKSDKFGKSISYEAINEITTDLPKDTSYWERKAKQLKKYDDELKWPDGQNLVNHEIMFTTNQLRTFAFYEYMNKLKQENNKLTLKRNLIILHSTPEEKAKSFIVIKKDHGTIANPELEKILANGEPVPRYNIVQDINQMKFVDSNPPTIYTMMILWTAVFKTYLSKDEQKLLRGNKVFNINTTSSEIGKRLSRFAPETNPDCIEPSWIEDALYGFKELNLATLINEKESKFEIKFSAHSGKFIDWIFGKINEIKERENDKHNPKLSKFMGG